MNRDTAEPRVREMPGEKARRWADYHHRFAAPTTYVYDFVWDITEDSVGPFCTDVDGNVLLDFTSHVAAAPLGYNNPKIAGKLRELDVPDPTKIAGQDFYASGGWPPEDPEFPGPTQLMERLVDITGHYDMDTVFLSNSGAEAVENAIKICYNRGGHRAFTFDGAFHGRTLGALSLNRSKVAHRKAYPEIPGVVSVPYCACEGECDCGWKTDGPGGNAIADYLDPDRGVISPEEVAYLILEPVQGEGGYRIPNDEFIADIAEIRERFGVKVVADEIQSGMGRTGEMWAVDHLDLEPDVITSAKALRVGATISRADVFPEETGRLSSTWGAGDVIASLQGALTIDAIREHDLLANATERGRQARELIEDAAPETVVDVRGRGLMLAVEFDTKDRREAVVDAALSRGLLTLGCGYKTLRILPPLDVTEREIGIGIDLLLESIEETA
ncbi:aminotransferase class III-fold pyridoxal phosphate-dependent enzyme [Haladaptatus salinisoli]|uniref:aminotransferase class III-fold pyridoxal phosphate-dependent enzyme n=1 Tax=Haladaptatus salinisoli TaxID=2884876 RepID=UPI001D0B02C7|nr:aminotransferase class III-fold pyridoxal phosphate-dependent enzyme [Haladaptatus salinisoli]